MSRTKIGSVILAILMVSFVIGLAFYVYIMIEDIPFPILNQPPGDQPIVVLSKIPKGLI